MTLFVAVVHDRHHDPVIRAFGNPYAAITWAAKNFKACLAHPEGCLQGGPPRDVVLWQAFYKFESDHAWVEAVELDDGSDA